MTEETRKAVIVAYQERKREEIQHPLDLEGLLLLQAPPPTSAREPQASNESQGLSRA